MNDPRVESNRTQTPWPEERCVHELFEAQAQRTPEATAVQLGTAQLTYRELDEKANQLANALRKRGVGPDVLVGLCLERSLQLLVGIYGILKAGGAYVPLDPKYPQERLAYMIESSRIRVLVTEGSLLPSLPKEGSAQILALDSDVAAIRQESTAKPDPLATPSHLIYVIFTSGSTGTPKGAAVYHRGFTNLIHWFTTEFAITETDRALLISSLSFDLTQKNLYATLVRGGTLHLYPPGPYDVSLLGRLILEHGITLLNCTPSAFYPLIEPFDETVAQRLSSLRAVFLGGEPISILRVTPWMTHPATRAEIANTYGPTECTDICGAYRLTRDNLNRYPFVPLGRPIYNAQLVIVDPEFKPCPIEVAGELCVAGAGVGAGYVNDSALTASKFVTNPFPEIQGSTLYKTGDQARWLPDGVIEFMGRLDHQVKIRGFRIELHEIESALQEHPELKEAVVVVVKRGPDELSEARLACFFTLRQPASLSVALLKRFADDRLPE